MTVKEIEYRELVNAQSAWRHNLFLLAPTQYFSVYSEMTESVFIPLDNVQARIQYYRMDMV